MPLPRPKKKESKDDFEKFCEFCGKRLVLNSKRDIHRKKFCSHSCKLKKTHQDNPQLKLNLNLGNDDDVRAKAGKKISERMKKGEIPLPPKKKKIYPDKFCVECGKKISKHSKNNLCQFHFNKSKKKPERRKKKQTKMNNEKVSKKVEILCEYCGRKFVRHLSRSYNARFCSVGCKNHYYSKQNKSSDVNISLQILIKTSDKYYNWRDSVLKRDNYTCCHCGFKGSIHVHHIKTFSELFS